MLAEIIDEAKRTGSEQFKVIPIVLDNLGEMRSLIEAALRYNGTRVAPRDAYKGIDIGERGEPDDGLLKLVKGIQWPSLGNASRQLTVEWTGGLLQVRFGSAGTPDNPGDQASLSLYTALLEPGFDSQVGALVYDETPMDDYAQSIAWSTLLDDLSERMRSNPRPVFCRSLLVFVGVGGLDWARHCRPHREGARYVVLNGTISKRSARGVSENMAIRLVTSAAPLVFYLGAGASRSSGLLTGDQLRDRALARMFPAIPSEDSAELKHAFFEEVQDKHRLMQPEENLDEDQFTARLTLERVLREEIKRHIGSGLSPTLAEFDGEQRALLDSPGKTVEILRQSLTTRGRLVLLTVNFDQMIEHDSVIVRGYKPELESPIADGVPAIRLFVTEEELGEFPAYFAHYQAHGGIIPLVKLHGSIDLGTVIADVDKTLPGLSANARVALDSLAHEPDPITWIYVGCSMRDLDVQRLTNESRFALGTNEYWVAPVVDRHVIDHVAHNRTEAWTKAERPLLPSRTITWSSDEFFEAVEPYLHWSGEPAHPFEDQ